MKQFRVLLWSVMTIVALITWMTFLGCPNPASWDNGSDGTAPAAPSNFLTTALSSSQIELTWTDNSDNEDSFLIERSLSGGEPWSHLHSTTANSESYTNSGLSENTIYYYRLCACNSVGSSSAVLSSAVTDAGAPVPSAPTGLSAYALDSTSIRLSWTDNSSDETGFRIECKPPGSSSWTEVTTTAAGTTTFDDTGLSTYLSYYYRVCAVNGFGFSAYSNEVLIEPEPTYTLTITINPLDSGTVAANPSRNVYTYETDIELVATPASGYSFTDWSGGTSGLSNPLYFRMPLGDLSVTANFALINQLLDPPSSVSATQGIYTHQVVISWDAVPGASWYNIYRSTSNNPNLTTKINSVSLDGPPYEDVPSVAGRNYYYFVSALNVDGEGPRSDTNTYGYRKMSQPLNLSVTDGSGSTYAVHITWIGAANAVRYRVYKDGVGQDTANNFAYTDLDAMDSLPHSYQVSAIGENGSESELSTAVSFSASP